MKEIIKVIKRIDIDKKYYKCELIFEGQYKNDEKNGEGIGFYYDGKLKYIGNSSSGKWNGKE